jgi:predicted ATPase
MLCRIEALHFRCLQSIKQDLDEFHVLVGPNASGKTTFLDTVGFLGDLVSKGLDAAIDTRSSNFRDLLWKKAGNSFELAIEAAIPPHLLTKLKHDAFSAIRYEVRIGLLPETGERAILTERAILKPKTCAKSPAQLELFPRDYSPQTTLQTGKSQGTRTVVNKVPGGNDNFYSETYNGGGKGWAPAFKLGPHKSALGNLPEDETKFPVASWLKQFLSVGVQRLVLNSQIIRNASPPGQIRGFKPDGSNLPWVVAGLRDKSLARFQEWVQHIRTSLPDLVDIQTVEREDDRHRYLVLKYSGGLEVPSWMASDGTLRLLALTLPAYLPDLYGVYLIEEPENGIHPCAIETMFKSLNSTYSAQILMATHSPVILKIAEPRQVLCFAKNKDGATDVVRGDDHPALRNWKGEVSLGTLFASGVLG